MSDAQNGVQQAAANTDPFDPVGFVVLAFGNAADADRARASLLDGGYDSADLLRYSGADVLTKGEAAHAHRGLMSYLREESESAAQYTELAQQGAAFLLVRAESDAEAARVMTVARRGEIKRAVQYGALTWTDLA